MNLPIRAPAIRLRDVTKRYSESSIALDSVSLDIEPGEFVALMGPSGSGKTTLLSLCAGLDHPTSGEVVVNGDPLARLDHEALCRFRRDSLGFVFQGYQLFPFLTAVENAEYVCLLRGDPPREARGRALDSLARVGLEKFASTEPGKLSGGQQQRVAIARALASNPRIILADEPTANLDTETAMGLIHLFGELNEKNGITFVFSTHDARILSEVRRVVRLRDGRIEVPGGEGKSR